MPISLNPECRRRLLQILTAELPKARVDHGHFLKWSTLDGVYQADEALPDKTRHDAAQWISETPFSTFVLGSLSAQLTRQFEYNSNADTPLSAFQGYEDPTAVAEQLLSSFETLPWKYTFLFDLSLLAHEGDESTTREYPLTETASLVAPGPEFADSFELLPEGDTLSLFFLERDSGPRKWLSNHYYLKLAVDGFVEDLLTTRPVEDSIVFIRCVAGLLMGSGGVYSKAQYSLVPSTSPIHVYLEGQNGRQLLRSQSLPSEYAEKLRTLEWIETENLHGAKWAGWMNYFQNRLRPVLEATHDKNAIRRAAQWYFDSQCGSNQLLQFVQATVALEILLGDKASSDVVGIAELLANRCAYLLAESHAERSGMLREVKDLYSTRSQIVHRGKHRLSNDEFGQLAKLRSYTRRVIHREIDLLSKT